MAETLFTIFGEDITRQTVKNVARQPLSNIENMGKSVALGPYKPNNIENMGKNVTTGPYKPNEPTKKGSEPKKSFLSNMGKALQSTPARKVFTPKAVNLGSLIYSDDNYKMEDVEFTRPKKIDDHRELFEYILPEPEIARHTSPPGTPPPVSTQHCMSFDDSYQDEFFTDDFSNGSIEDSDLGLPALY